MSIKTLHQDPDPSTRPIKSIVVNSEGGAPNLELTVTAPEGRFDEYADIRLTHGQWVTVTSPTLRELSKKLVVLADQMDAN